jgi:hypothetical protein
MHCRMKALALDKVERLEVERRRVPHLGPGHVEAGNTDVAVAHRELSDLERAGRRTHGREQRPHHDGGPSVAAVLHACGEAGQHRLGDRLQVEAFLSVELRGEADFGIYDPVVGQVLNALAGDTLERLRGLHHGDRVLEAF